MISIIMASHMLHLTRCAFLPILPPEAAKEKSTSEDVSCKASASYRKKEASTPFQFSLRLKQPSFIPLPSPPPQLESLKRHDPKVSRLAIWSARSLPVLTLLIQIRLPVHPVVSLGVGLAQDGCHRGDCRGFRPVRHEKWPAWTKTMSSVSWRMGDWEAKDGDPFRRP